MELITFLQYVDSAYFNHTNTHTQILAWLMRETGYDFEAAQTIFDNAVIDGCIEITHTSNVGLTEKGLRELGYDL